MTLLALLGPRIVSVGSLRYHHHIVTRAYATNPLSAKDELARSRRIKNNVFGLGLLSFILGVYYYSIAKVSQDDFADVDAEGNLRAKIPK